MPCAARRFEAWCPGHGGAHPPDCPPDDSTQCREDPRMDRRQMVVQRAREYFGDRLDDVLHMIRQDRQELRGWQEPAHLRATVRRTVREEGSTTETTQTRTTTETLDPMTAAPFEMARNAGEPNPGQQREAFGQMLEVAGRALE